jgi:hypothetical protein
MSGTMPTFKHKTLCSVVAIIIMTKKPKNPLNTPT